MRAVVADDTAVTRQQLGRILKELGVDVVASVDTGVKALQACLTQVPDVLLSGHHARIREWRLQQSAARGPLP